MVPFISAVRVALSLPVCADDTPADLELIIAVDSSPSMDANEQLVQRQGYVSAFRDPDLVLAITAGWRRRVAVAFIEWSGPTESLRITLDTLARCPESFLTRRMTQRPRRRRLERRLRKSSCGSVRTIPTLHHQQHKYGIRMH
jgi:hypothetical protein